MALPSRRMYETKTWWQLYNAKLAEDISKLKHGDKENNGIVKQKNVRN